MQFYSNLQKRSLDLYGSADYTAHAWLLSSHRATRAALRRAQGVAASGLPLMADNGSIAFIRATTAAVERDAMAARRDYSRVVAGLGKGRRIPWRREIPDELRGRARAVAERIFDDVDERWRRITDAEQLELQLAMNPSHLIAREDWSIAVLLGLGLERELLGWDISRFTTRNRQSLRGWAMTRERLARDGVTAEAFVTLAACDYATARAAAREAATWGAENVALGFAGLNKTPGYTDVTFYPRRRRLTAPAPRRYVRLAEIVVGFRDGYRETPATLRRFHALGLGSRPMWRIVAAALDRWTRLSIDSTAPIKDAEGSDPVVYDPTDVAERVGTDEQAEALLRDGRPWVTGPFLDIAAEEFPADLDGARTWWRAEAERRIRHDDLRSGAPLATALPMYAHGRGTSRQQLLLAHHNYWACDLAATAAPQRGRRAWALAELDDIARRPEVSVTVRNGCRAAAALLG